MKKAYSILFIIVGFGFISAQESQNLASSQPMPPFEKSTTPKESDPKYLKLSSDEPLNIPVKKIGNQISQSESGKSEKLASESDMIPPEKTAKK